MSNSAWRLIWLFAAAFLLVACAADPNTDVAGDGPQTGRVLLWHTWTDERSQILERMLGDYQELNPNVEIISIAVAPDSFVDRFTERSGAGLGPDLALVDAGVTYELAERGLIRDLAPLNIDLSNYLATAVSMVTKDKNVYGLPFSVHTQVLYYNKDLVSMPPETLAELVNAVDLEHVFAFNTNFVDSYWGVGAYDGGIVDSRGRLLFGLGGFTNWLDFLNSTRGLPGFLLSNDADELEQAFVSGQAAYYVADSNRVADLAAVMGEDKVGIAPLPIGPNGGVPRPFLAVDNFVFTEAISAGELAVAIDLATFLGSAQSQLILASANLGGVPVNSQIRLTANLPPDILTIARQTRAAEPILYGNRKLWNDLQDGVTGLFDNYRQVSQGILTPAKMVEQTMAAFEDVYGMQPRMTFPEELCPKQPGAITVWHALQTDEARVFDELARQFEAICPGIHIKTQYVPDSEFAVKFIDATRNGEGPEMLFESSRWLPPLVEAGLLLNLTERVAPRFLQQFVPETVEAMRYRGRLYGIPESVSVLALFYNRSLVSDPPIDLQQLTQSVSATRRLALPVGFFWGYWGMQPFGGFTFDSFSGKVVDAAGLTTWLRALQKAQFQPGINYYFDDTKAEDAFAYEEAAYLVTGPWSLPRLRQETGVDRFRVVPLPNGPEGPASPILQVQGTMISADASALAIDLALAFSQFINLRQSQERFLGTGSHVTASVTVDLNRYPNLASFREQAKTASLVVENSNYVRLEQLGNQLYKDVLSNGADPAIAVPAFVDTVNAATTPK